MSDSSFLQATKQRTTNIDNIKMRINKACEYAAITLNLELLIMKVFKTNLISIHCITQCGFTENKRDDEVIEYILKLNKYGKRWK